jgi:diadenosine tetraphosphate (Ap4A) HIT family hydrolase
VPEFFSLSSNEPAAMWQMVGIVRRVVDEQHSPDALQLAINAGDAAGQTVEHAHIHEFDPALRLNQRFLR